MYCRRDYRFGKISVIFLLILLSVVASLETRFYGVTQMDLLACLLTYSGNSEIYVAMIVNIHIH